MSDHVGKPTEEQMRAGIETIADQLCFAVDGNFDFRVDADVTDPSLEKLHMLINFVLESARRAIEEQRIAKEDMEAAKAQAEASCRDAEKANRVKSDFLATMSHELRTPLTAILGFTSILKEDADKSFGPSLEIIQRNGEQLLQIINDILDLAKIEVGRMETKLAATNPANLIKNVISPLLPLATAKNIELHCNFTSPLPHIIQTDAHRLRQILTNLIGNAIKFTTRGGVHVEAHYEPAPRDRLCVDVLDSGIGINSSDVAKLFEPFSQIDSSMSRKFGGTGLGLVISKRLAEILGGDIRLVESTPGKGSRFRCEIAANTSDDTRTDAKGEVEVTPKPPEPPSDAHKKSIAGVNILLVEDGPDNQRLITRILERRGAIVSVAENGKEGVDQVIAADKAGRPYDIVLMDMQMPVMDGYTATEKLRGMKVTIPIVALTAHAMIGDSDKCLSAGCSHYATKPINPGALVGLIADALRPSACLD